MIKVQCIEDFSVPFHSFDTEEFLCRLRLLECERFWLSSRVIEMEEEAEHRSFFGQTAKRKRVYIKIMKGMPAPLTRQEKTALCTGIAREERSLRDSGRRSYQHGKCACSFAQWKSGNG